MDKTLTFLRTVGDTIYDVFAMPGDWLLSQLILHAPVLAAKLGIASDQEPPILLLILSTLTWIIVALLLSTLIRLLRGLVRISVATLRTISFRISLALHNCKTLLVLKLGWLIFWRRSRGAEVAAEVELDQLDLAVLRFAKARGPGVALSVRELANQFGLRPVQLQRSLNKLSNNRLLDPGRGSTDGFDGYRLTRSGATFLAMWQRQQSIA